MQTMPPMPSLLHENGIGIGGGDGRGADVKVACDFAKLQMRRVLKSTVTDNVGGRLTGTLLLHCFNERDKGPCVISALVVGM